MLTPRSLLTLDDINRLTDFMSGPCLDLTAWFRLEARYADIVSRLSSHPAVSGPYPSDSALFRAALTSESGALPSPLSAGTACAFVLHATPRLKKPVSCVLRPYHSRCAFEVQASLYPPTARAFYAQSDWHGSGSARALATLHRALAQWWSTLIDDPHLIGGSLGFEDDSAFDVSLASQHPQSLLTRRDMAATLGQHGAETSDDDVVAIRLSCLR